ncbi:MULTISPECIES: hypothetical protein [unclassified Duganella]|uniref:hypothetical protein n=1 Tax=unclassified Duganella TaxID=2636909 RepID=UPI0011C19ACC|nr:MULTISPECIES: hypothetical protein [unclassified Duganella]
MTSKIVKISKYRRSIFYFLWKLLFVSIGSYQLFVGIEQVHDGAAPSTLYHFGAAIMYFLVATDEMMALRKKLYSPVSLKSAAPTPRWFAISAVTCYSLYLAAAVWYLLI